MKLGLVDFFLFVLILFILFNNASSICRFCKFILILFILINDASIVGFLNFFFLYIHFNETRIYGFFKLN